MDWGVYEGEWGTCDVGFVPLLVEKEVHALKTKQIEKEKGEDSWEYNLVRRRNFGGRRQACFWTEGWMGD